MLGKIGLMVVATAAFAITVGTTELTGMYQPKVLVKAGQVVSARQMNGTQPGMTDEQMMFDRDIDNAIH
jgi:hypothetical protein